MVIHPMVETFHLKSKQINLMVALDEKSEDQERQYVNISSCGRQESIQTFY